MYLHAQFLNEIKKEFEIPSPASQLTLCQPDVTQPDGMSEIKPTATINSLGKAGKDGDATLIVKTTPSAIQPNKNHPKIVQILSSRETSTVFRPFPPNTSVVFEGLLPKKTKNNRVSGRLENIEFF
jgi:hypothetical protein